MKAANEIRSNSFFGPWPDVPIAHGTNRVETPTGVSCWYCETPINEDDFGMVMVASQPGLAIKFSMVAMHGECSALSTIGHHKGICNCNEWGGTGTVRLGALRLWQILMEESEEEDE